MSLTTGVSNLKDWVDQTKGHGSTAAAELAIDEAVGRRVRVKDPDAAIDHITVDCIPDSWADGEHELKLGWLYGTSPQFGSLAVEQALRDIGSKAFTQLTVERGEFDHAHGQVKWGDSLIVEAGTFGWDTGSRYPNVTITNIGNFSRVDVTKAQRGQIDLLNQNLKPGGYIVRLTSETQAALEISNALDEAQLKSRSFYQSMGMHHAQRRIYFKWEHGWLRSMHQPPLDWLWPAKDSDLFVVSKVGLVLLEEVLDRSLFDTTHGSVVTDLLVGLPWHATSNERIRFMERAAIQFPRNLFHNERIELDDIRHVLENVHMGYVKPRIAYEAINGFSTLGNYFRRYSRAEVEEHLTDILTTESGPYSNRGNPLVREYLDHVSDGPSFVRRMHIMTRTTSSLRIRQGQVSAMSMMDDEHNVLLYSRGNGVAGYASVVNMSKPKLAGVQSALLDHYGIELN